MALDVSKYLEELTSENEAVLRRALAIVEERAQLERDRGMSAERRSGTVMVGIGVLAGFAILTADRMTTEMGSLTLLTGAILSVCLILLAKAVWYVLRTLELRQPLGLKHTLAASVQAEDIQTSLRTEIAWKQWEIDEMVPANTERLFWLARSSRNTSAALLGLLLLGMALAVQPHMSSWTIRCAGAIVLVIGLVGAAAIDPVAEEGRWSWGD